MIMGLALGAFFIGMGLLAYKYPTLIAGYNTMPKKEREKINIKPVARKMRLVLIIMGSILIVVPFLLKLMGVSEGIKYVGLPVIFTGIIVMFVWINRDPEMAKINNSANQRKLTVIGLSIVIPVMALSMFAAIYKVSQPAVIDVTGGKIIISGAYGVEISLNEITKVEVVDHIPGDIRRINGLGIGNYGKGHFQLEEYGRSLLFTHSKNLPYLVLTTENHGTVIINRNLPEEIYELQRQISEQ